MDKKKRKKTDLASLGEFELINKLTSGIHLKNKSSKKGVGDDAAVLDYKGKEVLVSTDLLLEGIHFNLVYTPLKHLGYKAVIVNLSDIYAMNGTPRQIVVSIGASSKFKVEDLQEIYRGIKLACLNYSTDLVGGDTSSSLTGLTISITAIGEAVKGKIVYRNTARVNDLVCVSGDFGGSFMGLQLLEREWELFENVKGATTSLEGHEYIVGRQLKPEARNDIIRILETEGILPSAMIDVSDGISSDLLHITRDSDCGCHIYSEKIPVAEETRIMAEELNMDPLTAALNGGEDYELLFTVPLEALEKIKKVDGISIIGHIVEKEKGNKLVMPDHTTIDLVALGWQHQ